MSSDVMQHELVERARESGTLTKADITKARFIYWLGAEVSSSYERLQSLIFCASMTPIIKSSTRKRGTGRSAETPSELLQLRADVRGGDSGISIAMEEQKPAASRSAMLQLPGLKPG